MISTYKEFQINVERMAGSPVSRAQVLRDGSIIPYRTLDDAIWIYAADCEAATNLARFFIDGNELTKTAISD